MYEADIRFDEPVSATVSLIADDEESFQKEVIERLNGVKDLEFVLITDLGPIPENMLIEAVSTEKKVLN